MNQIPASKFFPPVESADSDGVVGFGGKLTPEWLLDAYQHGIFPWPTGDPRQPIPWCSPDPRAIFEFDKFHVPRRLRQIYRSNRYETTIDRDFPAVIRGCATSGDRRGRTWITPPIIRAYIELHEMGHAHSVESWLDGDLVGGLYGVAVAGAFAAESMFYRAPDASKVALVRLVEHLQEKGYVLLDIQQLTPHTARFGAIEIPRAEYLCRLDAALKVSVAADGWK
jgi:leucyl/phenylalanyl-tRNA--protein transferase